MTSLTRILPWPAGPARCAADRPADRADPATVHDHRHGPAGRGRVRPPAPRSRRRSPAGGYRRLPAVHHRGDALHCRARRGRRRRRSSRAARLRPATSPGYCASASPRPATKARETAGLAAAVGTNFSLDLLTEASDLDPGAVVTAVDELWRQRIMRELGDGYDFAHDLLRETAYHEVSPPRQWLLHRRVAQSLELLHARRHRPGRRATRPAVRPRRPAGPGRRVLPAGRRGSGEPVRTRRGHPAAPRGAGDDRPPAGQPGPGQPGTRGAAGHGRAAECPARLLLCRAAHRPGPVDRTGRVAWP